MRADEIRKRYPNPHVATDEHVAAGYGYCVGGALCRFLKDDMRYPTMEHLGRMLEQANPSLAEGSGESWAAQIN